MNKLTYNAIGLMLLLFFINVAAADPAIMITDYEISPAILFPGDDAVLSITISNTETTATHTETDYINSQAVDQTVNTISANIDKVWIDEDGDGTNSIYSDEIYQNIGSLAAGASITLDFPLTTQSNISEGLYFPFIRIDVDTYKDVQFPLPVRISNKQVQLISDQMPTKISQSGSTSISINVVNRRKNTIEDAVLTIASSNGFISTPDEVYIGSIDSEESKQITYAIKPEKTGTYEFNFTLQYLNGYNVHKTYKTVSIEIISNTDVSPVLFYFPSIIKQSHSERISLEVYNAKTDQISGVIVTPITDLSLYPSQFFIGEMDADDVFTASFDIDTDETPIGNYSIDFLVSFKQDNNYYEATSISKTIQIIPNESVDESGSFVLYIGFIALIIICVLGYFYYKKWRHP